MVRINLVNPQRLSDQHLIAEYNEILMLRGHVLRHPLLTKIIPTYRLGKGHILFFKDKILYLQKRHQLLKEEMKERGFHPKKKFSLRGIPRALWNEWRPRKKDLEIIERRIFKRIKEKPLFYRYYRQRRSIHYFRKLLAGRVSVTKNPN